MKKDLISRAEKTLSNVLGHYTRLEVIKGKGSLLFTADGKKLLDFASGIAVTNTGHCHPEVVKAIKAQADSLIHNCAGVTYAEPIISYAEKLKKIIPVKDARFFFNQSGSEAVEAAIKAARYTTKKPMILALDRGFHGRTYAAMSATSSNPKYSRGYGKLVADIKVVKRDLKFIKKYQPDKVAAVITELVLGEAGYLAEDKFFIKSLADYCQKNKILLIIDEVQTGFARTGKMFACEWYGIKPDIIALAKAMASGLPMGAVAMNKKISDSWTTSAHGGTFGGNPVAAAAASATLDVLSKELPLMPKKIKLIDQYLDLIKDMGYGSTGLGFMRGIQLRSAQQFLEVQSKAVSRGLLLISNGKSGDVIRLAPPVTISLKDLNKGMQIITEILARDCI